MKKLTNSDKEILAFKRESKRYNQKSAFYGAVWSNDCTTISSKAKQAQTDYEMKQKHQAVAQEVSESKSLTQPLSDRLINRVYIFKDNQIEIDYATKDFLVPD